MNRLKKRVRDIKYHVGCDNPDTDGRLIYPYIHYLRRGTSFNGYMYMNNLGGIRGQITAKNGKPRIKDEEYVITSPVVNVLEDSDL